MSSVVDSDVSHFMLRALLMELARIGSATPRTIEEPPLGFDKFSSRSALRSSFTVPVSSQYEDRLPMRKKKLHAPSEISFAFSSACAALLNGEKLTRETIFLNFPRSCMDFCTASVMAAISSRSLTSKTAYPDADSNKMWVAILMNSSTSASFGTDERTGSGSAQARRVQFVQTNLRECVT